MWAPFLERIKNKHYERSKWDKKRLKTHVIAGIIESIHSILDEALWTWEENHLKTIFLKVKGKKQTKSLTDRCEQKHRYHDVP